MVVSAEAFCLVVYDVPDDAIRHRFSETCLDYGLERFQMSAFSGMLTATRRKEIFHRLRQHLGMAPGRILVQPVCSEDLGHKHVLHQGQLRPETNPARTQPKHRQLPEPGRQRPTVQRF